MIVSFLLRIALVLAGLVFAATLVVVLVLLATLWSLRALWGRLTGRPVAPFAMRFGPRAGFENVMRRAPPAATRTPRADAASQGVGDVTDVEPRQLRP